MIELKPCPFCGGTGCVVKTTFIGYGEGFFHTVCLDCNLELAEFKYTTEKDAIEAWNRRDGADE